MRRPKRPKNDIPKQDLDQLIRTLFLGNQMLDVALKYGFREFVNIAAADRHGRMLDTLQQHSPAKILRTYTQFNFVEWTAKLQKQLALILTILQNSIRRLVQVLVRQ